jgi:GTP-binding protein
MEVMSLMDRAAVAYQAVLTKVDAVPAAARRQAVEELAAELAKRPAAHPRIIATSARGGEGIAELRAEIAELAAAVGPR